MKRFIEGSFEFYDLDLVVGGECATFSTLNEAYADACRRANSPNRGWSWIEVDEKNQPTGAKVHAELYENKSFIVNRAGAEIYRS